MEYYGSFGDTDEVGGALVEYYWSVEDQLDFN